MRVCVCVCVCVSLGVSKLSPFELLISLLSFISPLV